MLVHDVAGSICYQALACGDLAHALPFAPEFFVKEFSSKVADMCNSVRDRNNAQASLFPPTT